MLRRACSSVEVVPFKRPEVLPDRLNAVSCNVVNLIGVLACPVRKSTMDSGVLHAWTSLLVPRSPTTASPIAAPRSKLKLVFLEFWDDLAHTAAAHLIKSDHIFVSGSLLLQNVGKYNPAFRVRTRVLRYVHPADGPVYSNGNLGLSLAKKHRSWEAYFSDPSQWWDNRFIKGRSIFPDFKNKETGVGLWITDNSTPPWARARLLAEQSISSSPSHGEHGIGHHNADTHVLANVHSDGDGHAFDKGNAGGHGWVKYFRDPSQWWDNRLIKRSDDSPDFKHKATGDALWISSWRTPEWVKARFAEQASTL